MLFALLFAECLNLAGVIRARGFEIITSLRKLPFNLRQTDAVRRPFAHQLGNLSLEHGGLLVQVFEKGLLLAGNQINRLLPGQVEGGSRSCVNVLHLRGELLLIRPGISKAPLDATHVLTNR